MFYSLPIFLTLVCCYDVSDASKSHYWKDLNYDNDAEIVFPDSSEDGGSSDWENPPHPFQLPKYVIQPPSDYSYTKQGGAKRWPDIFPECGGDKQSPIDIPSFSIPRKPLRPLFFQDYWDNKNTGLLNNTGKHAKLTLQGAFKLPTLAGGPLKGNYTFDQVHFHWGPHDSAGSEHTVDLEPYSMEAHVVHYKTEYGTVEEAAKHKDGLVVVAFFLQADKYEHNKLIKDLINHLPKVRKALSVVRLSSADSLFKWFKVRAFGDYATYSGSLTTPPCAESVKWIVFIQPSLLSGDQVNEFRKLKGIDGSKIKINYRHVQRLLVGDLYGPLI